MDEKIFPREKALSIVNEYVKSVNLKRHMLAVEVCMRFYAKLFNTDADLWGITGLLHDFDWEIHPNSETHPFSGADLLRQKGVDEEIVKAILSHGEDPRFPRTTKLEKCLCACDELTGFITAVALVRPSRSLSDLTSDSVKKKWKNQAFAAAVDRTCIEKSVADFGLSLWEHVDNVIFAMREISRELGL